MSYEKTHYIDTKKSSDRHPLETKNGNINHVENFKYIRGLIQKTVLNLTTNEERNRKLHRALNHYNKRDISTNAKLRHYTSVVLPEALYGSDTLVIMGKRKIKGVQK